jgi:hypothetical protein
MNYQNIDNFVTGSERRLSRPIFTLGVAIGLLMLGAIYVRPEGNYIFHGVWFEKLANNPFNFSEDNELSFRILTPLISYMVGLRGRLFIITNLIITAIFIGMVYDYFRKTSPRPGDALIASTVLTFSSVVLVTIYYSGFCDILSYLAIFVMWRWRRNIWLFALFFAVALFNHEGILFLFPWFAILRLRETESKFKTLLLTLLGLGIVIALYILFRKWVAAQKHVNLSLDFYFTPLLNDPLYWMRRPVQYYGLGLFTVFKALWIIPLTACYFLWKDGRKREIIFMALPVILASFQLIIAWDTTRMLTLGFITMVLALEYLFKTDKFDFRKWVPGLIVFNLFLPQLYTASSIIEIMRSTPMNLLRMLVEHRPWWP